MPNSPIIILFKGIYTPLATDGRYHIAIDNTTRSLYAGSTLLATAYAPDHIDFSVHAWVNPEHRACAIEFARQENPKCRQAKTADIEDAIYRALVANRISDDS